MGLKVDQPLDFMIADGIRLEDRVMGYQTENQRLLYQNVSLVKMFYDSLRKIENFWHVFL